MKTKEEIEKELGMFFGTENYYKMGPSGKMVATDGVSYLANAAECFWLIDIILSVQHLSKIKNETFQIWNLSLNKEDSSAVVKCMDDYGDILYVQDIEYTDFPLDKIKLWVIDNVIMLPSEY